MSSNFGAPRRCRAKSSTDGANCAHNAANQQLEHIVDERKRENDGAQQEKNDVDEEIRENVELVGARARMWNFVMAKNKLDPLEKLAIYNLLKPTFTLTNAA